MDRTPRLAIDHMPVTPPHKATRSASNTSSTASITVSYSASSTSPGNRSHSCHVLAAFLPSVLLALLLMAASSSFPTRSSDRARRAVTQISTTFRDIAPFSLFFFNNWHNEAARRRIEIRDARSTNAPKSAGFMIDRRLYNFFGLQFSTVQGTPAIFFAGRRHPMIAFRPDPHFTASSPAHRHHLCH